MPGSSLRVCGFVLVALAVGACGQPPSDATTAPSPPGAPAPPGAPSTGPSPTPPVVDPPPRPVEIPADLALSPAGREALQTVVRAPHFGGWAVGAAGSPTQPVTAFRTLLGEARARDAFLFALRHGTLAGQLTALSGLFYVDPARFRSELSRYRSLPGTVRLMTSGCDPGGDLVAASVVVQAPNSVQLTGPDDDLSAWSTRNPGRAIVFDIAGGGYPSVLRGRR